LSLHSFIRDGLPASVLESPRKEVWVAIRSDSLPLSEVIGDGTIQNPYDGSTAEKFDRIMNKNNPFVSEYTEIHLGPGVFQTKGGGGSGTAFTWSLVDGQKIRGSGIYQTILLLVAPANETPDFKDHTAIASALGPVQDCEISDLTIDCGMSRQPITSSRGYPFMSCAGININGRRLLVRRVRIVNFGTMTPGLVNGVPSGVTSKECFPCSVGGYYNPTGVAGNSLPAYDVSIEDCIVEQPFHSNARETTVFSLNTGFDPNAAKLIPSLGCGIRRCYEDLDYVNPRPYPALQVRRVVYTTGLQQQIDTLYPHVLQENDYVEISGAEGITAYNGRFKVVWISSTDGASRSLKIQMSSDPGGAPTGKITLQHSPVPTMQASVTVNGTTTATLTTIDPHKRLAGDWVAIRTGTYNSILNGTFQVLATDLSATVFKITLPTATSSVPSQPIWLDRRSSQLVRIKSVVIQSGSVVEVETVGPHWKKPDEWAQINGVGTGSPVSIENIYNGFYKVENVSAPTKFTVTLPSVPPPVTGYAGAKLGAEFHAVGAINGYDTVVERNRIVNARIAGAYQDTWSSTEQITRKNYLYDVHSGPYLNIQSSEYWHSQMINRGLRGGTYTYGAGILRITLGTLDPGVPTGTLVQLTNRYLNEPAAPALVELWVKVSNTGIDAQNKYFLEFVLGSNPFTSALIYFWPYFTQGRLLWEENIIDLAFYPPSESGEAEGAPFGFWAIGRYYTGVGGKLVGQTDPWTYRQVSVRGNIIRKRDNVPDPYAGATVGISIDSAEECCIVNNIINNLSLSFYYPTVLRYSNCKGFIAFNNQTNRGKLILAWNDDRYIDNTGGFFDDLQNTAEDWLLGL
jgi:hypothetical protein